MDSICYSVYYPNTLLVQRHFEVIKLRESRLDFTALRKLMPKLSIQFRILRVGNALPLLASYVWFSS